MTWFFNRKILKNRYNDNVTKFIKGRQDMKQILKLILGGSLFQAHSALATTVVTAKCPGEDFLNKMSADKEIADSQKVNWIINKGLMNPEGQQISSTVVPDSFSDSGWEKTEAVFQNNPPHYTPYLTCSVGDAFRVIGFFPDRHYQSCTLPGSILEKDQSPAEDTLKQDAYYKCDDANACELSCSSTDTSKAGDDAQCNDANSDELSCSDTTTPRPGRRP